MNKLIKLVVGACLFLVYGEIHAQKFVYPEKVDTFSCSLFFSQDDYTVNLKLKNNAGTVGCMDSVFRYCQEKNIICYGDINGFASIDGITAKNLDLSKNRAFAVENYLFQNFPFLEQSGEQSGFNVEGLGEDWDEFSNRVLLDNKIPGRQQLIDIINDNSLSDNKKKLKIKELAHGETYSYLMENIFPALRKADIRIKISRKEESLPAQPEAIDTVPRAEIVNTVSQASIIDSVPRRMTTEPQPAIAQPVYWAVKTNLLYWAADLIINAGVEYSVGKQWSIDFPVTYSPYTVKDDWRMRTLSMQPEVRWWTNRAMTGHFFGFHGQLAWYNISTDKLDRYQDKDGKTPLWGFGLSYGYAFRPPFHMNKHWNMEAVIGFGYARLNYDIFYNVHNGAKYENDTKNYWGITQAALNLIYIFN